MHYLHRGFWNRWIDQEECPCYRRLWCDFYQFTLFSQWFFSGFSLKTVKIPERNLSIMSLEVRFLLTFDRFSTDFRWFSTEFWPFFDWWGVKSVLTHRIGWWIMSRRAKEVRGKLMIFVLKTDGFTMKSDGFLMKSDDFLSKINDFLSKTNDF